MKNFWSGSFCVVKAIPRVDGITFYMPEQLIPDYKRIPRVKGYYTPRRKRWWLKDQLSIEAAAQQAVEYAKEVEAYKRKIFDMGIAAEARATAALDRLT